MGHELRNPLGVISNAVYFLRLIQPGAADKVKEYLGVIEGQVRIADKIIGDLLLYGRSRSVDLEHVSLARLADDALARFPPPANVAIDRRLPDDLPSLHIDLQQMAQVLGNLLVNAYQAMPGGGEVIFSAQRAEAGWLAISIQDHGEGIASENLAKVFEPLFSTKPRGIGLGLAVSRKLTEANGGRIDFQSAVGAGSAFTITLPIIEEVHP